MENWDEGDDFVCLRNVPDAACAAGIMKSGTEPEFQKEEEDSSQEGLIAPPDCLYMETDNP